MTREEILFLFDQGKIDATKRDRLLSQLAYEENARAEASESQDWLKKVKQAPLHVKARMVKEQSANLAIEAAGMEGWEAKEKKKKSYNFANAIRGAGGFSF